MRVIDPLSVTKAISRIGSPQRGHRSGKTCVLGAPSRPLPGPGFGREHAMEADQMQPWTRNERGQALHELQG